MKNEKVTVIEYFSGEEENESEENLSPHQNYSQEEHLISSELIQENQEGLGRPIREQGMNSGASFA